MTIDVQGLGDLVNLAAALGLVQGSGSSQSFNADWFSRPDYYIKQILRDGTQRDALLAVLQSLSQTSGESAPDDAGPRWIPIVHEGAVSVHVVIEVDTAAAGVHVGIGARLATDAPNASTTSVLVPLLFVPESSDVEVALGTAQGRVHVDTDLTFASNAGTPSGASLAGLHAGVDVPTDGSAGPAISITLRGLLLPGQSSARDVALSMSGTNMAQDALHLLTGLLQQAVGGATGEIAEVLSLLGLGPDPALPALPVGDLFDRGLPSFLAWLEGIFGTSTALAAWLGHLSALVGHGATAAPPATDSDPFRVAWSLASGISLGVDVMVTRPSSGVVAIEIGFDARWDATGGRVELDIGVIRFALGPVPTVVGLPDVSLTARLGSSAPGATLIALSTPAVAVGSLETGFAIGADRTPRFVLAATNVSIGAAPSAHAYPVLDLTNPQTLVDVGTTAVTDLLDQALGGLGPAGVAVRTLLGLAPPGASPWPVATVSIVDLLSNPAGAVIGYHARVLHDYRAGYDQILGVIGTLLAAAGAPSAVLGDGSADRPWRMVLASGASTPSLAIVAWTSASPDQLHLGLSIDATVIDLGGGCPRLEVAILFELARVGFSTPSRALPAISAAFAFGARGGGAISVGISGASISADRLGVRFSFEDGRFATLLEAPNLTLTVDGTPTAIALPSVDSSGALVGSVPWNALQLLAGHVMRWSHLPALKHLCDLLGWTVVGSQGALSLERLVQDPLGATLAWLEGQVGREIARWFSLLIGGPASPGAATGLLLGRGDPDDPYRVPLAARGVVTDGRVVDVIVWPGAADDVDDGAFRPPDLFAWLNAPPAIGDPPPPAALVRAMWEATLDTVEVSELLEARSDLGSGLALLQSFWSDSDGVVPASAATFAGATAHELALTHGELPGALDLNAVTGRGIDPAAIFVSYDDTWPGLAADRLLALDGAGLPPEAMDVRRAQNEDGPWLVRIPRRADSVSAPGQDGRDQQALRIERVIAAVVGRTGPSVRIIAHAAAGHAALLAGSRAPGVTHVVTLGTPHGSIDLSLLETQPAAGAIELLSSFVPPVDPSRPEIPNVGLGRRLLESLTQVASAEPSLVLDLTPPSAQPAIPGTLSVHCVFGRISARDVSKASCGLVVRGLQGAFEREDAKVSAATLGDTRLGFSVRNAPAAATGAVRVAVETRLALFTLGKATVDPELFVRVTIDRPGGWLAGGPDPARPLTVSRHPSVRRAAVEVDLPFGRPADARARIVLHEAEALGVRHARWVIGRSDLGADGLAQEARVAIGRAFSALAAAPAPSATAPDLSGAIAGLGLADSSSSSIGGVSVDGLQRLLLDPAGYIETVRSSAGAQSLARAVAAILGAPAPAGTSTAVDLVVDGVHFTADLAAKSIFLETAVGGVNLASGLGLEGQLTIDAAGARGRIGLALGGEVGPSGRAVLQIQSAPLRASLDLEQGPRGFPASVSLYPSIDSAGLARMLVAVVPAQLLWAGVTFVRTLAPGAVAIIDPVLRTFGLLDGTGDAARVHLPVALLQDPARYLLDAATLGAADGAVDPAKLSAAIDAIAALIGLPAAPSGGWQLPYGAAFRAETRPDGHARLSLSLDEPIPGTGLRAGGGIGLILPRAGENAAPDVDLALALPGGSAITSSPRLAAHIDGHGFSLSFVPGIGSPIQIVPNGPGLNGLASAAAAAVTYALPYALDAIAGLPASNPAYPIGQALGMLGDALGLRVAGRFSGTEIQALAANPGSQIAQRLSSHLSNALSALVSLISPAFPPSLTISASSTTLTVQKGTTFSASLSVPTIASVSLTATLQPLTIFGSAQISATLTVDASGLRRARVGVDTPPASPFSIGPFSLAPFVEVDIGAEADGGPHAALGLNVGSTHRLAGSVAFAPFAFQLQPSDPGTLAETLVELLVPIAADLALSTSEVQGLLARSVLGGVTIQSLLDGVILLAGVTPPRLDPAILVPSGLWPRLLTLAGNIAARAPALNVTPLALAISARPDGGSTYYGLGVSLASGQRFSLVQSDLTLDLEIDASWIDGTGAEGIVLEVLQVPSGAAPRPHFGLTIRGVGLRFGRASGPLLDTVVGTDSIALHSFFAMDTSGVTGGGGQLELTGFRIGLGGGGGTNQVAQGIMQDSASGGHPPRPKLSPALALQRHGSGDLEFDLRAGDGNGPWWVTIQTAFGPVYIEQVGFGVDKAANRVTGARVLVDGRVSLLGLTVSVEGLSLGANWPQSSADPPLYDPRAWDVDLLGLGVAADMSGVEISGGLSRSPPPAIDYVGTVTIRFDVYGISAFGGYAMSEVQPPTTPPSYYTSLFLFGALTAPLGGPPMFFVTGIGAGVGINRLLKMPPIDQMPGYPLVQALDINSPVSQSPDQALDALRAYFPESQGAFWIAAGISFTCYTIIEGIIVLGVAIGDGLEIDVLGLARAGLPNPAAPLVEIELALLARFSTKEGVLWIQAQLTDNSWLLTKDCRLTGGFAFVTWFKGPNNGQFVITLGGYHPSFHHDGYPVVPRLGFVWNVSGILVIKGESYFALTSEAIMAGTKFEARLDIGPLWAYIRLGADGIVYFDPFSWEVSAFAELGAGITIDVDLFFGHVRITISIKLHADVLLAGPEFRGRADIDLGIASASIEFGDWTDHSTHWIGGAAFTQKYLQPQNATILTSTVGLGLAPPNPGTSPKPATGGPDDPFLLLPEFTLAITSTGAASTVTLAGGSPLPDTYPLAIGPMNVASVDSTLDVSITDANGTESISLVAVSATSGQFPKAIWAALPPDKHVPSGDMIEAIALVTIDATATPSDGTVEITANQVTTRARKPLPFIIERWAREERASDVETAHTEAAAHASLDTAQTFLQARTWLSSGSKANQLPSYARILMEASRRAPPRLAPVTYGMAATPPPFIGVERLPVVPIQRPPYIARPPNVIAVLTAAPAIAARPRAKTTVTTAGAAVPRVKPPTLARVHADMAAPLGANLKLFSRSAASANGTVTPKVIPFSGRAGAGREIRSGAGFAPSGSDLAMREWRGGEIAVLEIPDAGRDRSTVRPSLSVAGSARVVFLDVAGGVLDDRIVQSSNAVIPQGAARIAVIPGAGDDSHAGWHAGAPLIQIGPGVLIGPGCTVTTPPRAGKRGPREVSTGFARAVNFLRGNVEVTTSIAIAARSIAILVDRSGPQASAPDLDLGLEGAARELGPSQAPLPPITLVSGDRLLAIYAVVRDPGATAIEVNIAVADNLRISGVIASLETASVLAADLAAQDAGRLIGALVHDPNAKALLRWTAPNHKEGTDHAADRQVHSP
jgi:hypothetical protein